MGADPYAAVSKSRPLRSACNSSHIHWLLGTIGLRNSYLSTADTFLNNPFIHTSNAAYPAFHRWHDQIDVQLGRASADSARVFACKTSEFWKFLKPLAAHMSSHSSEYCTFLDFSYIILGKNTLCILAVVIKFCYNTQILNGSCILNCKRLFQSADGMSVSIQNTAKIIYRKIYFSIGLNIFGKTIIGSGVV